MLNRALANRKLVGRAWSADARAWPALPAVKVAAGTADNWTRKSPGSEDGLALIERPSGNSAIGLCALSEVKPWLPPQALDKRPPATSRQNRRNKGRKGRDKPNLLHAGCLTCL